MTVYSESNYFNKYFTWIMRYVWIFQGFLWKSRQFLSIDDELQRCSVDLESLCASSYLPHFSFTNFVTKILFKR